LLCLTVFLSACGAVPRTPDSTPEEILLPASIFEFAGTDVAEEAEAFKELGSDYVTSARAAEEGVYLTVTREQRENLKERNNEYMSRFLERLVNDEAGDGLYAYELSEAGDRIVYSFDEQYSAWQQLFLIYTVPTYLGLNQALDGVTDWSVSLTIMNCHTGREVVTMNLPEEIPEYTEEEWEKSYE